MAGVKGQPRIRNFNRILIEFVIHRITKGVEGIPNCKEAHAPRPDPNRLF